MKPEALLVIFLFLWMMACFFDYNDDIERFLNFKYKNDPNGDGNTDE